MIEPKDPQSFYSEKIKSEEEALEIVNNVKMQGKKVGLCVGVFDLLHAGHMLHFRSARNLCDFLVVGVTSDRFAKARKGDGRPIYQDYLRAFTISQLMWVDCVFISNYLLSNEAIKSLKPNYFIKGPDWKNKNTPDIELDRQIIKEIGGEILYTSDEKLSTTEIINYIKNEI